MNTFHTLLSSQVRITTLPTVDQWKRTKQKNENPESHQPPHTLCRMSQFSTHTTTTVTSIHISSHCALSNSSPMGNDMFYGISYLLTWCFEPSQPQRITSGLNTNFTPSDSFQKSCFLSLFIFCRHSTWEPASGRVTFFILQAYTGIMC